MAVTRGISLLHDLGLAVRHCTGLILLGEAGIAAEYRTAQTLPEKHKSRWQG